MCSLKPLKFTLSTASRHICFELSRELAYGPACSRSERRASCGSRGGGGGGRGAHPACLGTIIKPASCVRCFGVGGEGWLEGWRRALSRCSPRRYAATPRRRHGHPTFGTVSRLARSATDAQVRSAAQACLGNWFAGSARGCGARVWVRREPRRVPHLSDAHLAHPAQVRGDALGPEVEASETGVKSTRQQAESRQNGGETKRREGKDAASRERSPEQCTLTAPPRTGSSSRRRPCVGARPESLRGGGQQSRESGARVCARGTQAAKGVEARSITTWLI